MKYAIRQSISLIYALIAACHSGLHDINVHGFAMCTLYLTLAVVSFIEHHGDDRPVAPM